MVELPAPFADIPRLPLLFSHPPAIEPLPRLSAHLAQQSQPAPTFWIANESHNSSLSGGGGNKLRKLEYVLADARNAGAKTIVTTGGVQSNHMRQTAAAAARYGFQCVLLQKDLISQSDTDFAYHHLGNVQLDHLLGAKVLQSTTPDVALAWLRENDCEPYFIPAGASTHPLGGLGFARWAFELVEQEAARGVHFDTIFVATASGSTAGGMLAGLRLVAKLQKERSPGAEIPRRRLVSVLAKPDEEGELQRLMSDIARDTGSLIGLTGDGPYPDVELVIEERFHAGAYGRMDAQTRDAIKSLATLEGIVTDPVYTGKALAGILGRARSGDLADSKNVLFVHTGGQTSCSAYPSLR
ncbi:tryptophan synthase beta subunit-like PLP-dependent enzyme [Schizophyllum commune H4-8]|uniref:Tryptophan synthase beta chain-like PALP domain-containing protein n=1 Tax=Schizophyllum commune (strain H4-8 / FGSC 9210) TaxID=578458 RepID=D8PYX6_SCHCM|nr:tryptophan synthase beta subunit-like PLP-dependent enzyme [Schizophyllum commune H4-8]KAI5896148.1 tryptophan synthase beta subunit-like PLP-dependent enzyme [Schizophyllum commune H4-8]